MDAQSSLCWLSFLPPPALQPERRELHQTTLNQPYLDTVKPMLRVICHGQLELLHCHTWLPAEGSDYRGTATSSAELADCWSVCSPWNYFLLHKASLEEDCSLPCVECWHLTVSACNEQVVLRGLFLCSLPACWRSVYLYWQLGK